MYRKRKETAGIRSVLLCANSGCDGKQGCLYRMSYSGSFSKSYIPRSLHTYFIFFPYILSPIPHLLVFEFILLELFSESNFLPKILKAESVAAFSGKTPQNPQRSRTKSFESCSSHISCEYRKKFARVLDFDRPSDTQKL